MKKILPFYIIVFSIFFGITSFDLLSDGMFFDGVFYANLSKVMGLQYSGFWNLKSCLFCDNVYGHPPLAIYLESLLFRFFGDSIYIERIYSFSTYIFSGGLIHIIFQEIFPEKKNFSWIALLLWIIIPIVTWGASNNMLENTMTIFVLLAVFFIIKYNKQHNYGFLFLSGFFLFCGFLSKGFVAFFPLSLFLWIFLVFKKNTLKREILNTLLLLLSLFFFFFLLYLFSLDGIHYLINYFNDQLLFSLQNINHTVSNRFYIVYWLFNELIPPLILIFIVLFITRKNNIKKDKEKQWFIVFLLLGLSGVIPIMISLKQSRFYFLSSLPFFSLAFAFLIVENIKYLIDKYFSLNTFRIMKKISIVFLLISVSLAIAQKGRIGRDVNKIKDVYSICQVIEKEKVLSIPNELFWDWSLQSYFLRYGSIVLSSNHHKLQEYYIIEKTKKDNNLNNYELVKEYNLYKLYRIK